MNEQGSHKFKEQQELHAMKQVQRYAPLHYKQVSENETNQARSPNPYIFIGGSSACKSQSANLNTIYRPTLAEKSTIVTKHNTLRAGVSPTATNMMTMYYNEDLENNMLGHLQTCQCRYVYLSDE